MNTRLGDENDGLSFTGKKRFWNAMEGPLWAMKASMLGVDEVYVIDGAAMIFCCIQVKHPIEVLESQDGCELPPPDLVTLVPEESKENPADSVAEDADADDDNDVDDTNDADEAAHVLQSHDGCDVPSRDLVDLPQEQSNAGSKIEDLRNKLEESSNRIVAFGIEINTLKDLRSRENKQFGIEINTLKDLRSRENKQFKDARFQTNENHKNALKQMADKMKDIKIEMRKSYENAREQDKRACQENEKLWEENKKLREENKNPRQDRIADYYTHQKEQLHDIAMPMMQSQHFSMGRSAGFSLGGTYSLHRPQQQQQHTPSISSSGVPFPSVNNQDLLHLHGSDMLQSSHSSSHSQTSGPPGIGLRLPNSPNMVSGMVSYDQRHQNQFQFWMQQMSGLNHQGVKSMQSAQAAPDSFGFLGLLRRMRDPDLRSLALGIDLTTRGLNLNSTKNLNETFGSPWSDEPAMGDPEFIIRQCYYAKQPPALSIQQRLVLSQRAPAMVDNKEPLVKTDTCEGGSHICFDPSTWETTHKDNLLVQYDMLVSTSTLAHSSQFTSVEFQPKLLLWLVLIVGFKMLL